MRYLTIFLFILMLVPIQAKAADFNSYDDVVELLSTDELLYYCSTCSADGNGSKLRNWTPSLDGLPDVDTTGVAAGDLLMSSGGTEFVVKDIGEVAGHAAVNAGGDSEGIFIGTGTSTGGNGAIIIGHNLESGTNAIILGRDTTGAGFGSIALGAVSNTAANAVGIGHGHTASGNTSVCIGRNCISSGQRAVAVGSRSTSGGFESLALGHDSSASGDDSTALGKDSSCAFNNSAALGADSSCTAANQIMLGTASETVHIPGEIEFASAGGFKLTPTTVGALGSAEDGRVKIVNDATGITDCTTGGGSTYNLCVADGTNWNDF